MSFEEIKKLLAITEEEPTCIETMKDASILALCS